MPPLQKVCKNCKWWERVGKTQSGYCIRYSPSPVMSQAELGHTSCHPVTMDECHCGDFSEGGGVTGILEHLFHR
jgi:hypothetical protein